MVLNYTCLLLHVRTWYSKVTKEISILWQKNSVLSQLREFELKIAQLHYITMVGQLYPFGYYGLLQYKYYR